MSVNYSSARNIGTIKINRSKNNPLDLDTLKKLSLAFEKSNNNGDICVILLAAGKNFTVGADLKYIHKIINQGNSTQELKHFSKAFQDVTRVMLAHQGIILVGLHGWVVGGGFEICLSADLRIASKNTRIKLPELYVGTMFSNASTKLLPQIIGLGRAKDLMFTGREITAEEAKSIGLVNRICEEAELESIINQLAEDIVSNIDPLALKLGKALIHKNLEETDINLVLQHEAETINILGQSEGFLIKINEFFKKK